MLQQMSFLIELVLAQEQAREQTRSSKGKASCLVLGDFHLVVEFLNSLAFLSSEFEFTLALVSSEFELTLSISPFRIANTLTLSP